jgi:hypothetical protein
LLLELLAIVLLSLAVVILALLLIPFQFFLEANMTASSTSGKIRIRWLGLTVWRTKPEEGAAKPGEAGEHKEEETGKKHDIGRPLRILALIIDSRSALAIMARSFRKAVKIRRVSADVTFGLGDPAETALLAGYLWSVAWIPSLSPRISLSIRPDMESIRLEGWIMAQSSVRLLPLVAGFLRSYTQRSFRRLIKEVRS